MRRNRSKKIPLARRIFIAVWLFSLVLLLVLGGGHFFISYLPSVREFWFMRTIFPFIAFIFLILPVLTRLFGRGWREISDSQSIIKTIGSLAIGSVMVSWACSSVLALPTLIFGRAKSSGEIEVINNISGFRMEYSSRSWIAVEEGVFPRRFLWSSRDIADKNLKIGDCIEIHGRTIGFGLVPAHIDKVACH